jgi:NDP-4-keto-2,6-dideoxyhexose 3-C-methyltransferase
LNSLEPFLEFAERTKSRATELLQFIEKAISEGKTIRGVGASTKGNCLLQFTGLGSNHVLSIAEINTEKFGCVTPGSHIKIENQQDVLDSKSDEAAAAIAPTIN